MVCKIVYEIFEKIQFAMCYYLNYQEMGCSDFHSNGAKWLV